MTTAVFQDKDLVSGQRRTAPGENGGQPCRPPAMPCVAVIHVVEIKPIGQRLFEMRVDQFVAQGQKPSLAIETRGLLTNKATPGTPGRKVVRMPDLHAIKYPEKQPIVRKHGTVL